MTIPSLEAYRDRIAAPDQRVEFSKGSLTTVAGRFHSAFGGVPFGGAAPTASVVCTNATAGSLRQDATPPGKTRRLLALSNFANGYGGFRLLVDRLVHNGGMSGAVAGAQTTNLPTAALTRYTSGLGVFIGIDIYVAVGTTAQTISATYTNELGTGGRVTPTIQFGAMGFNGAARFFPLPLQQGDRGVRSVESVTVSASTGTAGNFGVVLFKPLIAVPSLTTAQQFDALLGLLGQGLQPIEDGACLVWLMQTFSALSGIMQGAALFGDD